MISSTSSTRTVRLLFLLCGLLLSVSSHWAADAVTTDHRIGTSRAAILKPSERRTSLPHSLATHVALTTRGGAEDDKEDSDSDDSDSDDDEETVEAEVEEVSDDESEDEEEDAYTDDEEEEAVEEEKLVATVKAKSKKRNKKGIQVYDEPYFMSPSMYLYTTFVPILIGRKLDLFHPRVVRLLRFLFITQLLVQQAFIFYVRVMAKTKNDRTVVHVENPLNAALKANVEGAGVGSNAFLKNLASSFMSKDTSVMEYDMDQAKNMQTSMIITMIITWFMHFKLQQVQPLLVTIISGYFQLFYNPLFQVYILGRNLERPFKAPNSPLIQETETDEAADNTTDTAANSEGTETTTSEEQVEEEAMVEVEVEEAHAEIEESSATDSDDDKDEE